MPKLPSEYLTTTDVARICYVCPKTAAQWVDRGLLKGTRRGRYRQVRREDLAEFMRGCGMPEGWIND